MNDAILQELLALRRDVQDVKKDIQNMKTDISKLIGKQLNLSRSASFDHQIVDEKYPDQYKRLSVDMSGRCPLSPRNIPMSPRIRAQSLETSGKRSGLAIVNNSPPKTTTE